MKGKELILPRKLAEEKKLKEEMEARQRHAKLMEGWWDNWEYSDYRKALKKERKARLEAEAELERMTKNVKMKRGKNIK